MLTYYCPQCWTIITKEEKFCPNCGYEVRLFLESDYEEKLLAALHHTVPERRIMAAQILGIRKSQRALSEFQKIVESGETDYYFLRAVLLAVMKIDHPNCEVILRKALHNRSTLVSELAQELLENLAQNHPSQLWDHHTG